MTEDWHLEGDYAEACNCNVACQCIWLEPPDGNVCTVSLAWDIESGHYGDIDLSGLSAAMLVYTEEGVMFDPAVGWHIVLLVDESADGDQQAALEDIYFGRAGGIWAAVADAHLESGEVASVPIDFERDGDDISVSIGEVATMEVVGAPGFNEELGTITPHPLTSDHEMHIAKSTRAVVSYDEDFAWDVSGNNSYLGDFELASS